MRVGLEEQPWELRLVEEILSVVAGSSYIGGRVGTSLGKKEESWSEKRYKKKY